MRPEHDEMTRVTTSGAEPFPHQVAALAGYVAEIVAGDLHAKVRPPRLRVLLRPGRFRGRVLRRRPGMSRREGQAPEDCQ